MRRKDKRKEYKKEKRREIKKKKEGSLVIGWKKHSLGLADKRRGCEKREQLMNISI